MWLSVDLNVIWMFWDVDCCLVVFLLWFVWLLVVDGWELVEFDEVCCELIKLLLVIYCKKGMLWVICEIVWCFGFGEVDI